MGDKHTKLPWHKDNSHGEPYYEIWHGKIGDKDRTLIAEYVSKNNAEFIVKACNSHDELVETCKAVLSAFTREYLSIELRRKLNKAIAKAKA